MMKKWWFLGIGAFAFLLSGCSPASLNQVELQRVDKQENTIYHAEHYPISITNLNSYSQEEVTTYDKPPQRVIAIWQDSIETLLALGVGDRIVGAIGLPDGKYLRPEYQEQYEKIPYKNFDNPEMETAIMLDPDMIVGWYSSFQSKTLRSTEFWHSRGVHTYIAPDSSGKYPSKTVENEYQDILNMGKIFDREERANEIVSEMKAEIQKAADLADTLPERRKGIIVTMVSSGKMVHVYGGKTLAGDIMKQMHGELLAKDSNEISMEDLIDMDPDAIFMVFGDWNYGNMEELKNEIYDIPALKDLRCIREKRVYAMPLFSVYSAGTRTLDGIQIFSKGLYPELYRE